MESVKPKAEIIKIDKRENRHIHFMSVEARCNEKHSELPSHLRVYKGRVICRGDTGKDETGDWAIFSEVGSSASHLTAAKPLDVIARLPGCDGENSNAVGAYTQVNRLEIWDEVHPGEKNTQP